MDAAGMRSPAISASVRRGRRDPMDLGRDRVTPGATDRNPVTLRATDPSRRLSTKRQATTRRRVSYTGRAITTDRESIIVRAGAGADVGGGKNSIRKNSEPARYFYKVGLLICAGGPRGRRLLLRHVLHYRWTPS